MAVPRNRMSNARKNSKKAHHAKRPRTVSVCPHCGAHRLPHCLCPACGYYNGRSVLKTEASAE